MMEIENTTRSVEKIRSTSLAMRKLPLSCPPGQETALIAFCFGLLSVNFAPLWTDACSVLKTLSEHSAAKVWEMAFERLTEKEGNDQDIANHKEIDTVKAEVPLDQVWDDCQLDSTSRLQLLFDKVYAS
jgi:hypothetical protein